ncbi:MAG: class I SAM-dependent methyltransferase [Chloroflexota bacterium]
MDIQNAYNEWSETYDNDENLTRDLDQTLTRALLAGRQFDSILEIGCGTGKNTVLLAQIGKYVQAVDFSQGMIEKAREKVKAANVKFAMANITEKWTCEADSFDLIVCNLVLEHIENLVFVFSEAARTLKNQGLFIVNELHPFRQYEGKKARFAGENGVTEIPAFIHHITDFMKAAEAGGLALRKFDEFWHEADSGKPPRLVSFVFEKR